MATTNWARRSWCLVGKVCVATILAAAMVTPSQAEQLRPFDEGDRDRSLVDYRTQLLAAIDTREFGHLEPFLSPDIQLSFGGHYGIGEARQFFHDDPRLWDELGRVLRSGGGFETDRETGTEIFIAPYTYFAEAPPDLDPFEFVILTAEDVPVHALASPDSLVLGRYSYDIMPIGSTGDSDENWQTVALPSGEVGYVAQMHVATPTDYRAGLEKFDGHWKVIFFLAGD